MRLLAYAATIIHRATDVIQRATSRLMQAHKHKASHNRQHTIARDVPGLPIQDPTALQRAFELAKHRERSERHDNNN